VAACRALPRTSETAFPNMRGAARVTLPLPL
jgi:hypothetical protein